MNHRTDVLRRLSRRVSLTLVVSVGCTTAAHAATLAQMCLDPTVTGATSKITSEYHPCPDGTQLAIFDDYSAAGGGRDAVRGCNAEGTLASGIYSPGYSYAWQGSIWGPAGQVNLGGAVEFIRPWNSSSYGNFQGTHMRNPTRCPAGFPVILSTAFNTGGSGAIDRVLRNRCWRDVRDAVKIVNWCNDEESDGRRFTEGNHFVGITTARSTREQCLVTATFTPNPRSMFDSYPIENPVFPLTSAPNRATNGGTAPQRRTDTVTWTDGTPVMKNACFKADNVGKMCSVASLGPTAPSYQCPPVASQ